MNEQHGARGYVYVIDYGDGKRFKIGMTMVSPEKRLRHINKSAVLMPKDYGMRLVMSTYINYPYYLEQLLHARFAEWRDNGEWFELGFPELVETYQAFMILGVPDLYDRWFELVPEEYEKLIERSVIWPAYPAFKKRDAKMPDFGNFDTSKGQLS